MIVHGCIETHPKDYGGWIIVMAFRVLLISQHLFRGILLMECRKCKNKKFLHQDVVTMHLLTKGFMEDYLCWYAHRELFVPNASVVMSWSHKLITLASNTTHKIV
jgi:hypothetical protein